MLGAMLGSYRVTERLATGGMGEVYIGEHKLIGRKAAIKVLLPHVSQNQRIVERFFQEAKATAQLAHPGIVEIFDYGSHKDGSHRGERAYLIMEYLHGEALSQRIKQRLKMPLPHILALAEHVCDALGAAHAAGIIHRDLKPDNIFMVRDTGVRFGERPKLLDFGIAKLKHNEASALKTGTGVVMGTPAYMSPEQCRGAGGVDERSDLYSVGCILFELVCGRRPFTGAAAGELIGMHQFKEPPRPSEVADNVDPHIESIILKLLAKRPEDRFQSTGELARALSAATAGLLGAGPSDADASAEFSFADDEDNDATAISGAPVSMPGAAGTGGDSLPLSGVGAQASTSATRSHPPAPVDDFLPGETDPVGDPSHPSLAGVVEQARREVTEPTPMPFQGEHENSAPPAPLLPDSRSSASHSALAAQPQGKSNGGIKLPGADIPYDTPLTTLQGAASVTLPPPDIKPDRRPWLVIVGALAAGAVLLAVLLGQGGDATKSAAVKGVDDGTDESVAAPPAVKESAAAKPDIQPSEVPKTPGTAKKTVTDGDRSGKDERPVAKKPTRDEQPAKKTAVKVTPPADKKPAKKAKVTAKARAQYVTLTIESHPTGATVKVKGKSLGKTPVRHRTKRSKALVTFEIAKKGYKPASIRVSSAKTARKRISLKKKPKKATGSTTKIRKDIF